ncbi:MAG TPA: ABC transporter ATP-binding protein, partial [Thermodesulfobacteriota bacterium]|nr:ABC transporter ATP-binding protein [Thermodesulfobacteriota bacterium]
MNRELLLTARDVTVHFHTVDGTLKVLNRAALDLHKGEVVGIVGETGSGKSVLAKLILGILPIPPGEVAGGEILFRGSDLLRMSAGLRQQFKEKVAYIPQDPMTSLNPVFPVGTMLVDAIIWKQSRRSLFRYLGARRFGSSRREAARLAAALLDKVHIPDPEAILQRYPIQLSGGMRQRVLLAAALIGTPELLVADEPTTALDVTIQKRILQLIKEKVQEENLSSIYITHDLGVARSLCDRIYVMYAGTVMESGPAASMLEKPLHPYTEGLIRSIPKLTGERFE